MDQIFGKVGSYWFNQKATKELDTVGNNINVRSLASFLIFFIIHIWKWYVRVCFDLIYLGWNDLLGCPSHEKWYACIIYLLNSVEDEFSKTNLACKFSFCAHFRVLVVWMAFLCYVYQPGEICMLLSYTFHFSFIFLA